MNEKTILITNDDGFDAMGLRNLISFLKPLAKLVVISSETAMSGMGHSVTIKNPLRLRKFNHDLVDDFYITNGTPVDCVKLAFNFVLDAPPDLVVSGINHGSNSSINVFYSGTMAAAIEGSMLGINSIGFSAVSYNKDFDMTPFESYIRQIVGDVLNQESEKAICLNVNFPDTPFINGMKPCRMAQAFWKENFEKRIDTHGQEYYWLKGDFVNTDKGDDSDEVALAQGFISIVPISTDITDYSYLRQILSK